MFDLKQSTQTALENSGVPSEYAQPAAEILAREIQRSQRGEIVQRSAEEQRTINDAYFWYEVTEHDRHNGRRKS